MGTVPTSPTLETVARVFDVGARYMNSQPLCRPNLDRFGMPKDFVTYLWATYGAGRDMPPDRRVFLHGRLGLPPIILPSRDTR